MIHLLVDFSLFVGFVHILAHEAILVGARLLHTVIHFHAHVIVRPHLFFVFWVLVFLIELAIIHLVGIVVRHCVWVEIFLVGIFWVVHHHIAIILVKILAVFLTLHILVLFYFFLKNIISFCQRLWDLHNEYGA